MGARSTMLMDSADAPMDLMLLCAPGMLYWLRACTSRLSSPTAASRCPEATARMAMYPVSRIETSSMSRMGLAESVSVWCWRHRLASSLLVQDRRHLRVQRVHARLAAQFPTAQDVRRDVLLPDGLVGDELFPRLMDGGLVAFFKEIAFFVGIHAGPPEVRAKGGNGGGVP